jgi:hypothetical protein
LILRKFLFVIVFLPLFCLAQEDKFIISVSGTIIDGHSKETLSGAMVLNRRSHTGNFADPSGNFHVKIHKTDTLVFSVVGYSSIKICFADSLYHPSYKIKIELEKLKFQLRELEVMPERTLKEIEEDISGLGYKPQYQVEGLQAIASPVTFLYERFSRFEKQKRKAAELFNEEAKKDLLKELLKIYVKADIINLNENEFDEFLSFCYLPEEFIQHTSQYDLIMAVKYCYEGYLNYRRR